MAMGMEMIASKMNGHCQPTRFPFLFNPFTEHACNGAGLFKQSQLLSGLSGSVCLGPYQLPTSAA